MTNKVNINVLVDSSCSGSILLCLSVRVSSTKTSKSTQKSAEDCQSLVSSSHTSLQNEQIDTVLQFVSYWDSTLLIEYNTYSSEALTFFTSTRLQFEYIFNRKTYVGNCFQDQRPQLLHHQLQLCYQFHLAQDSSEPLSQWDHSSVGICSHSPMQTVLVLPISLFFQQHKANYKNNNYHASQGDKRSTTNGKA
jgi:hypothetical protein